MSVQAMYKIYFNTTKPGPEGTCKARFIRMQMDTSPKKPVIYKELTGQERF